MSQLTDEDREMLGLVRAPDDPPDTIVHAVDVARFLGVHPRTVQRWILTGKLRAHRMGSVRSRWRVSVSDLSEAFFTAHVPRNRRMVAAMIRAVVPPRTRPPVPPPMY